jgi:hypothetical protein
MGDWYISRQEPAGHWHPLVEETLGDVIEITLEFVMHLDTLIGALASRPHDSVSGSDTRNRDEPARPARAMDSKQVLGGGRQP